MRAGSSIVPGFAAVLFILAAASAPPSEASIPDFFRQLALEFREQYAQHHGDEFVVLCLDHGIDQTDAGNQEVYYEIAFIHDLLTGAGASNCARGGLLRIPYFWHWVEPNPRHDIRLRAESVRLVDTPPPAPYVRYRTQADIDRVPALYFSDLVTEEPRYSHPDCGDFYTFGWCSEREMAFTALMYALGYEGKIVQFGIHVWSVLRCRFKSADGSVVMLAVHVDNTFDELRYERLPKDDSPNQWSQDCGHGSQVAWYNRTARSSAQVEGMRNITVAYAASERIRSQVREALQTAR